MVFLKVIVWGGLIDTISNKKGNCFFVGKTAETTDDGNVSVKC